MSVVWLKKDEKVSLCDLLRSAREYAGLTMGDMARRLSISVEDWSDIENGTGMVEQGAFHLALGAMAVPRGQHPRDPLSSQKAFHAKKAKKAKRTP